MSYLQQIAHPALAIAGLAALVIGFLLRRGAARHDLKGALAGGVKHVALDAVRHGKDGHKSNPLAAKLHEVAAHGSHSGKAKAVAGIAARHFVAQVVSIAGLVAILGGLAATAAGIFWR
jgi:hypothetical protein